jgi:hypothetical protein
MKTFIATFLWDRIGYRAEPCVFIARAFGKCGRFFKARRIGVDNQDPFPYKNQQKLETVPIIR